MVSNNPIYAGIAWRYCGFDSIHCNRASIAVKQVVIFCLRMVLPSISKKLSIAGHNKVQFSKMSDDCTWTLSI